MWDSAPYRQCKPMLAPIAGTIQFYCTEHICVKLFSYVNAIVVWVAMNNKRLNTVKNTFCEITKLLENWIFAENNWKFYEYLVKSYIKVFTSNLKYTTFLDETILTCLEYKSVIWGTQIWDNSNIKLSLKRRALWNLKSYT